MQPKLRRLFKYLLN